MFNIPTQRLAKVTVTEITTAVTLSVNPIVISALSFTPRHLVLRWNARSSESLSEERGVSFRFNGDTGSNYNEQRMDGAASTADALRATSATQFNNLGVDTGDDAPANGFSSGELLLPDALSTRSHKSVLGLAGAIEQRLRVGAGRWANTAAITSITATQDGYGEFKIGSTFELCVVDESFNIDQDGDGEQILGSNGAFTVGSISAADGDLVCIGNIRSTRASTVDTGAFEFNSDTTGTNYHYQKLTGSSTTVSAASVNGNRVIECSAANNTTSAFSPLLVQVTNFSDGSNDRVLNSLAGHHGDSSSSRVGLFTQRWNNTAAVTAVHLDADNGDWLTGSMLSTYAVPKNLIERQELGGTATDVTFSSIPQTYDHLELTMYARSDRAVTMDNMFHNINGDTTAANYDEQGLKGVSSTVSAYQVAADLFIAKMPGASETANQFGAATVTFYNYTKTDRHKHYLNITGNVADNNKRLDIQSKRWENTAAITTIKVYPSEGDNFIAGSVFTLRGINAAPAAATDIETISGIAAANIEAVN